MKTFMIAAGLTLAYVAPAYAKLEIKPLPEATQVVRFDQGIPTIEEDLPDQTTMH